MEEFKLIAKTFQGLEDVLAKELTALGAKEVTPGRRMVSFMGNKELMYRANFSLRTAVRVLKPIATFKANDADEVYDAVKAINWNDYLDLETSFAVDSVVYSEEFRHSKFVAYKVKDAIVDFFREKTGKRPNISITNPCVKFNMHIAETDCTLSLDSSGESLHKRGYREATVESPINEVLAAGMIQLTGWHGECDLIDPMCGSGTIAIEAALIARNIAPGVFHKKYAFENWKDFDRDLLDEIYNDDSQEKDFEHHIYAYDIDKNAVQIALTNVKSAGVAADVTVTAQPLQQFKQPEEKSLMITNPPYGERISSPNLLGLYRTLGDRLKHQFVGNDAWVIGYREETFEQIGLKSSLRIPLFNGSLDCEFHKYQIFDGKLNDYRQQGNILKTDEERNRNASKRLRKPQREFDEPVDEGNDNLEAEIPDYILKRHREFIQSQQREVRHGRREDYDRNEKDGRPDRRREHSDFSGGREDVKPRDKSFSNRANRNDRSIPGAPEHRDFEPSRDSFHSGNRNDHGYARPEHNNSGRSRDAFNNKDNRGGGYQGKRPFDKGKNQSGFKPRGNRPGGRFNNNDQD